MDSNSNTNINVEDGTNDHGVQLTNEEKQPTKSSYDNTAVYDGSLPLSLLGRTLSASAADCKTLWRNKKSTNIGSVSDQFPFSAELSETSQSTDELKRKHSSQDYIRLPNFTNSLSTNPNNNVNMLRPVPTNTSIQSSSEFITPNQPNKPSRPNSPSNAGNRPVLPRGRVASIRRESDCSGENEAAHEKMVKTTQQVSVGFEDFCLDDKLFEERKRAKSLTEPISIFTNAFLIQSSSPSPTRVNVDFQKQCYSPSTQQVVRSNIPYSPSPSPTPGSPYSRMRSMSPCTARQITKRRYTTGNGSNGNMSGLESDGESSANSCVPPAQKRQCTTPRSKANASPLIRDSIFNLCQQQNQIRPLITTNLAVAMIPTTDISATCNLANTVAISRTRPSRPRMLVDPQLSVQYPSGADDDDAMTNEDDGSFMTSFYLGFDANSSTTFSSRANTPHSEMLDNTGADNDISSFLPVQSSSYSSDESSRCSSQKINILSSMVKPEINPNAPQAMDGTHHGTSDTTSSANESKTTPAEKDTSTV